MKKDIHIAMVAPSFGDNGGPEVVVQNLTNAMLEKGMDVALFAPADWKTKAKHIHTLNQSLWNMNNFKDQTEIERRNLVLKSQLEVLFYEENFDIVHLHLYRWAYPIGLLTKKPCLLTFHSKIVPAEFNQIKETGVYTVTLSNRHAGDLKADAVISNGIPVRKTKYSLNKGKYLITIGRLLENKGIDLAIKIAQKTGKKLLIFGRTGVGQDRVQYFNKKIKPFLNDQIIYMGDAPQKKIFRYLLDAEALLFPIRTPVLSVCPLVVMEALACGTPVIGTRVAPLEELPKWQEVAFLSNSLSDMTKAVSSIDKFDRKKCRDFAEKYFDSSVMADKYIALYKKILTSKKD